MRYFLILISFILMLAGCKKDKYTSEPQITYQSISGNFVDGTIPVSSIDPGAHATVNFKVTDAEGDLGFNDGSDTAKIYLKNLLTSKEDSLIFPDISAVSKKDFEFVASVSLESVTDKRANPLGNVRTDTVYYEIYVKDFKKNKSNVIRTGDPVFFKYR